VASAATLAVSAATPAWLTSSCDATTSSSAFAFDQSPNELNVAAPRGSGTWYARVDIPTSSTLYAATFGLNATAANQPLALCPSCADLPAATNPACLFATSGALGVALAGIYTIALPTDQADDDFMVVETARIPPR
jgi:hypothetical protein